MNQEERKAFEDMDNLDLILGAGFYLMAEQAEDAEKASKAQNADESESE
jgi:hypothetical protein